MTRVIRQGEARRLALPGRTSYEIVSGATAGAGLTFRRVEIPPARGNDTKRGLHQHADFEECIHVLSGRGVTTSNGIDVEVGPGDTILVSPGEPHATRNIGDDTLVLLCFFPVGDIGPATREAPAEAGHRKPE
ncbi:MAG TPA: cupin domain-containing protein [Casimicrobiaceae bacterium]|nr:cupin domain-containing protein [Casimicrobiaceae bacterium]